MGFLEDYQIYTEELEVPEVFHIWCAYSALSAAAQRKIWVDMGLFKIAPNLYLILVSPPGKCGKSTSMNIVRDLLSEIPTIKTKSDSITKEKIFVSMEAASTAFPLNGNKSIIHSSLTIFANEMSMLIKKGDKDYVGALNSLYDTSSMFRHSTKTGGENEICNPYLNIIGGTTPDWLTENIGEDIVEGGLSARTVFVYSETPKQVNPFPKMTPAAALARKRIIERLDKISSIGGEFSFSAEAREFYGTWYVKHAAKPIVSYVMSGYLTRKKVHLLKLSMLTALAERNSFIFERSDFEQALNLLDMTEEGIETALKGVGRNKLSGLAREVLYQIRTSPNGEIDNQILFASNYRKVNKDEYEEILKALQAMGHIKLEARTEGDVTKIIFKYLGEK